MASAKGKGRQIGLYDLPLELLHLIAIQLVFASASSPPPSPPLPKTYSYAAVVPPRRQSEISIPSSTSSSRLEIPMELPLTAPLTGSTQGSTSFQEPLLVPHPEAMIPLMMTCHKIYAALRFNGNERLYQQLYLSTFDSEAVLRRYGKGTKQQRRKGVQLSSTESNTSNDGGRDGMIPSVQRMRSASLRRSSFGTQMLNSSISEDSDGIQSLNLLTDPLPLANEYKERWNAIKRIRHCAEEQVLEVEGVFVFEDVVRDLWTVWWMVVENGKFFTADFYPREKTSFDPGILRIQMDGTSVSSRNTPTFTTCLCFTTTMCF